jgi:aromatic-L-amino-acid decarboxylase
MWLHVDAAYGGAAAVVPEMRAVVAGCERADSLVVNPHKWLLTPVDCSLLYTARPDDMRAAFSLVPEYLRSNGDDVVNLMDYGVALGRRFRSLKLWMVLRAYGADGLAAIVAGHIELARRLEAAVRAEDGWELLAPVPFSTVCFRRIVPGGSEEEHEAVNAALVAALEEGGTALATSTRVRGTYALRLCVMNDTCERADVERVVAFFGDGP